MQNKKYDVETIRYYTSFYSFKLILYIVKLGKLTKRETLFFKLCRILEQTNLNIRFALILKILKKQQL